MGALEIHKPPRTDKVTARLETFLQRKKDNVDKVLAYVEDEPTLKKFDEARQAISDCKATKVPLEMTMEMERKLVSLEEQHGPRLHAEENLLHILRNSELVTFDALDGQDNGPVLQD